MKRVLLLCGVLVSACMTGSPPSEDDAGSDEPADYDVDPDDGKGDGISATFDRHNVIGESLFENSGNMTVEEVQAFFEDSPYNNRSWLADYEINGVSAAQAIIDAAEAENIHPLMLLTRMQVEASLVSKTVKPSKSRLDRALGCGCPDGHDCASQYLGFDKQLTCGAKILRKWYDASVDGTGQWQRGVTRRTLDPTSVTPANHATASLYQYTPWVLPYRGGNWLVWNVTRKYVRHAEAAGYITE
ncbi:MAG: hypothetical protein SFX73_14820 [Kofleriaceae bacterium]|nr:hypothetical protein [Kofleriaceae bacterium]